MIFFPRKKNEYIVTPTQELLLALLRAQLWLKPVDDITLPSSMKVWDDLLNLAYKQTVVCFIAAACLRHKDVDAIPTDIKEELEAVIVENVKIHEYHNKILIELITKFEAQGLHPILLKGQGLAHMYDSVVDLCKEQELPFSEIEHCTLNIEYSRNSVLRQCGDIDLYFRQEEYEQAKSFIMTFEDEILDRQTEKYHHFESSYKGVTVEIHRHTSWIPNPFANKRFQEFASEEMKHPDTIQIKGKDINVPSPIYNLISVFAHMWHHFEDRGVSLRQMCDVVMIIKYCKLNVDRQQLKTILYMISHLTFWKISGCVFVNYLGLSKDTFVLYDNSYERRANLMLGIVLTDGAFNYAKDSKIESMSGIRKKIAGHLKGHREFMKVKPVVGNSIYWNYAAFKNLFLYRFLCVLVKE